MNKYILSGVVGGVIVLAGLALYALNPGLLAPKPSENQIRERVLRILAHNNLQILEMEYAVILGDEYGSGRVSITGSGILQDAVHRESPAAFVDAADSQRTRDGWVAKHDSLDEVPVERQHIEQVVDRMARARRDKMRFFVESYSPGSLRVPFSFDAHYRKTANGIEINNVWGDGIDKGVIDNAGIILPDGRREAYRPYGILGEVSGDRVLDTIRTEAIRVALAESLLERKFRSELDRFVDLTSQNLTYYTRKDAKINDHLEFSDCDKPTEYRTMQHQRKGVMYRKVSVKCTAALMHNRDGKLIWRNGFEVHPGETRPAKLEMIFPVKARRSSDMPASGVLMCLEMTKTDKERGGFEANRFSVGDSVCVGRLGSLLTWRPDMDGFHREYNNTNLHERRYHEKHLAMR